MMKLRKWKVIKTSEYLIKNFPSVQWQKETLEKLDLVLPAGFIVFEGSTDYE